VFGSAFDRVNRYAELLATRGVDHGLLGAREADRIWPRHLLNCAGIADLVTSGDRVIDLGSGAGLPGLVLAVLRPDVSVLLVEPMARRTAFLADAVEIMDLTNVDIERSRAQDLPARGSADVVIARALAPLSELVAWAIPLLRPAGRLLAMKGANAYREVDEARPTLAGLGVTEVAVEAVGSPALDTAATIVRVMARGSTQRPTPGRVTSRDG
jgi:16S rRNA (guanine527-N7)-methyltransferase